MEVTILVLTWSGKSRVTEIFLSVDCNLFLKLSMMYGFLFNVTIKLFVKLKLFFLNFFSKESKSI